MMDTMFTVGEAGLLMLHAIFSVVAREASQLSGVSPPAGGESTAYLGLGLLLVGGLAMVSSGMWWMFRLVTASGRGALPTASQPNRSSTFVDQLSSQRALVPRQRGKSTRASREITPFRPNTVTTHHPAFMQLFYALEARRTGTTPFVVHFVSPSPHAGVSTVTSGYARVAADAGSRPVLFVDASYHPESRGVRAGETPTLVDAFASNIPLERAIVPARNARNLLWTRLYNSPDALLNLGSDGLHALLDMLRAQHSLVALDCASLIFPQAAALSRYCDGSVLVVAAGITTQSEIDAAQRHIEQLGGQIVGLVLNRERSRASRWAEFA